MRGDSVRETETDSHARHGIETGGSEVAWHKRGFIVIIDDLGLVRSLGL